MGKRITNKDVKEALEKNKGIVSYAARALGCSRTVIYQRLNKYPDVHEAWESAKNGAIDYVEGKLFEQISHDNITAIIFYLKTQGKHRGYSERFEHTGANGKDLFSSDVVAILKSMGETPESAVKQFEAMIRQNAEKMIE